MFKRIFPFSAICGQEQLKLALILNVINPGIGGVLIRGEKGTAKSTAVRALAALLPRIAVVKGCPYSCDPDRPQHLCGRCRDNRIEVMHRPVQVVTLPLNATEDRVAGSIDFSKAVKEGARVAEPGLLAKAHRGILYVDEVNLLDDHVVDIILDSAASGQNVIEREGISLSHASRFVLVGTMNPEEGELRPQFLDRFGLCVEVEAIADKEDRVLLMERRETYDASPLDFIMRFDAENKRIAEEIVRARQTLKTIRMPKHLRSLASQLAIENNVAGHRADLIIEQAARAVAALREHHEVTVDDVIEIAPLALSHRRRDAAPPPPPEEHDQDHETSPENNQEETHGHHEHQYEEQQEEQGATGAQSDKGRLPEEGEEEESGYQKKREGRQEQPLEQVFPVGETFKVRRFTAPKDRLFRRGSGRRSRTRSAWKQGRYVKSTSSRNTGDVALDATLRAAAPYQSQRRNESSLAIVIRPGDVREKIREKRIGNFLLFVVDASGSMGARGRMVASKGAIMSLLLDAYQKRDRIAMVSFRRDKAVVNLPPTSSIELAARYLSEMPVGGKTPLSAGLARSYEVLRNYLMRDPTARPIVLIVTDGRSNVAMGEKNPLEETLELAERMAMDERVRFIVVDIESPGLIRFGLARKLAFALDAQYFKIEDLRADTLLNVARENIK
ncbi:MAG: putative cobaltochelatase [Deltaproteobacteria bacterium]|nr:putative cobaltochelatase [Deltaproteobacteria bacterium]MBW1966549.1 putative cobaltochelatase [Deltaproteobacteria bacterium]MBW2097625.1 putative cobaltochelatase [Deltaproteobacteria bacterium]